MMAARPAVLLAMAAAGALMTAGCGSTTTRSSTASTTLSVSGSSSTSSDASSPPTVAGQLPTVFDCGGGAYKPARLLIVCGVDTTMATDVRWSSWTSSSAAGSGTVRLSGRSGAPASLTLSHVVPSGAGPQFAQLQVTWTATSPDGHPSDTFQLDTAPAH